MADLKISQLAALAGANLATADELAIVDSSASETKKITVTDLVGNATTLIADATIPGAKILFGAGDIAGTAIADGGISTAKVADDAITAAKLGNESTVDLVTTLPGTGAFTGQIALDTDDNKIYIWDGSAWQSVKGAGSVNVVNGNTTGILNITVTTVGDTVTITPSFDNTTAAAQFLGGPTGGTGVVGYRAIVGTDLPTPTTSAKGGVIVNGEGLRMDGETIEVDNDITANSSTYQAVQFDSKGLITAGRDITAADLPAATAGAIGAIKPGTGLTMGAAGALNHTNALTGATATKVTFDAQGHITAASALIAADIPDLDTAKITTGTFDSASIADDAVTGVKLANRSTALFGEGTPTAEFIGQLHFNSITRDIFIWDGNVWQPIGISVGEIVLSGTFDASAGGGTGLVASTTAEGTAIGLVVGEALPAAANANKNYYLVVSDAGTITSGNAPNVALAPPDFILSNGNAWTEIDVSDTVIAQQASNVAFTPAGSLSATNVQAVIEELDTEKAATASPTFTGNVTIGTGGTLILEGASENDFETTLSVTDPTADRAIVFPDISGAVVTTGDTGTVTSLMITDGTIVDADINANAEIAVSKLVDGTARQLLQTDAAGTGVEWTSNIAIPGTLDVTGAAALNSTLAVTSNANAASFIPTSGAVPTNGFYLPAANSVAFATDTSERIRIGPSGEIGLAGTNYGTSGQVLTSGGSGAVPTWTTIAASVDKINEGNTSAEVIDTGSDGRFVVTTEGSEAMRIDSSGGLLVGTTTAGFAAYGDALTIERTTHCGMTLRGGTTSDTEIFFADGTTGAARYAGGIRYAHNGDYMLFTVNAAERMRIASSGNVGIGTSSPAMRLDVKGTVSAGGGSDEDLQQWNIGSDNVKAEIKYVDASASRGMLFGTSTDHVLAFQTNNTERLQIDSTGNVGIGTSAPASKLAVLGDLSFGDSDKIKSGSSAGSLTLQGGFTYPGGNILLGGGSGTADIRFGTSGASETSTERMRIDSSGRVGIGTSSPGGKLESSFNSSVEVGLILRNSSAGTSAHFYSGASIVGSITVTGSSTAFNTSSDYRLKENVVNISDGITRVKQLAPKRFNFIADSDTTVDGFLAHEAQAVVPEAVTGTHNEVDDDGEAVMQGIDQSKLVPLLTAALQEAIGRIETLEGMVAVNNITIDEQQHQLSTLAARLTALESA